MWVNGVFQNTIAISDRGFQYGDGVFETIEIKDGRAIFLERHLNRLNLGCERLLIPKSDLQFLTDEITQYLHNKKTNNAVLKIIITRGSGGRGYRQPDKIEPTKILSLHPQPSYPEIYYQQGINARFCQTRLGANPVLAGIKHLNRLEQVLARSEWNNEFFQEGIMLDLNKRVIEGTMSNLFYVKNEILYTAPIKNCGILGIIRGWIFDFAHQANLTVIEHFFDKNALLNADEAFVCNSVIGIWRIHQLESQLYSQNRITRFLQTELAHAKK